MTVIIEPGAAFGDGRHPTTRLAVKGLEKIRHASDRSRTPTIGRDIDIGTGSGILAIVAARLGVTQLDALDIDPCALSEAGRNIPYNRLGHRVTLCRPAIEDLEADYDLVMANLRIPTLCALADWVRRHARPSCYLLFSGFRDHEQVALQRAYPESAFRMIWSQNLAGWGGIVLQAIYPHPFESQLG